MLIRPKLLLTFLVLCLTPLLALGLINYWNAVRATEAGLHNDLQAELESVKTDVEDLLQQNENELRGLGQSTVLEDFMDNGRQSSPITLPAQPGASITSVTLPADLKARVRSLLSGQSLFASVALFDQNSHALFSVEQGAGRDDGELRIKDLLSGEAPPDERIWKARAPTLLRSPGSAASLGATLRCTVPVWTARQASGMPQAALIGELKLDALVSRAAKGGLGSAADAAGKIRSVTRIVIALDRDGRIVYHPNDALKHQVVSNSMPYFLPVATQMIAGQTGWQSFRTSTSEDYWAAYAPIPALDISLAVARNYTQALADSRQVGRVGLILSVLLGLGAALLLTFYSQRKAQAIDRVTAGVVAIAKGRLDQRIEVESSDDIRLLADNVNLMTERLREQIAREAEARQFQSFVKLSAMLTHDLKNAIGGLSLIVGNMEQHFNKEEFRVDAMNALTEATGKLKALVARLSNPVTTLSGEFKRPQPTDLVFIIKRVIARTAEPLRDKYQIELQLPQSLFALVDGERIEKVVENMVLNALEAMTKGHGTLTVHAGNTGPETVFFSVSDTGMGMSRRFIEERLFRPFATTKSKGVGLGLYTCREVVRANGGTIEVDSREGAGTTFRVVLPSAAIEQSGPENPS